MVRIDKNSSKAYYEQLVLGIKEDILHGILRPGDQLPSVREMAVNLMMNPNTISKAYKVLESEQILLTVKGKGTFVKNNEKIPRDERRIQQLQEQLNEWLIEARHLHVTQDEIFTWIRETEKKLGGPTT